MSLGKIDFMSNPILQLLILNDEKSEFNLKLTLTPGVPPSV